MLAIAFAIAMHAQAQAQDAADGLQVVVHDGQGRDHVFALDDEGSHTICTDQGENVILIEDGSVRMEHADCPNGDCMRQAPLTKPGQQLICLPHKLWVELVPVGEASISELDTDAVIWIDGETARDAGIDAVSR